MRPTLGAWLSQGDESRFTKQTGRKHDAEGRIAQPRNDRTSPQPLVLFCFGLFWSTRRTNAFCSALPPGYTEVVQESRGDGGAAAGQGSGGRLGPAPHRPGLAGRRRPVGGGSSKNQRSPQQNLLCWRSEPRDLCAQCTVSAQIASKHFSVPSQARPTDLVRA